ncbi:MAG: 4Fe-4S binding protein [Aminipila sp.]
MTKKNYFISANRIFTKWRAWSWIFTLLVAFGGIYEPKLGLLVFVVIAGLLVTSFFGGRYWCGNICAHGSLYDQVLMKLTRNKAIPKLFKSKILITLFLIWFGGKITFKMVTVFMNFSGMDILDRLGFIFVSSYLMVLIIGVPLGLVFTPRTWCQFCPMGTMQKLSYKLGNFLRVNNKTDVKISIASKDACHSCGKCSRVCPMQLEPHIGFDENNQFSSDNCIKCKTCVENCPAKILSLEKTKDAVSITDEYEKKHISNRQKFNATIKEIRYLEKEVMEIVFDLGQKTMNYKAGQFVLVQIQSNPIMMRAYTVSGYNTLENELRITVKKVKNGYGTDIIFDTFKVGQRVNLEGPMGEELIVDKSAKNILLVAAGIGITPFIPILEELKAFGYEGEVKLVYGARHRRDLHYCQEIKEIIEDRENMQFIPVVSRDKDFNGEKGYVTDVISKLSLHDTKIYMCAAKNVAKSLEGLLDEQNFNKEDFFVETA